MMVACIWAPLSFLLARVCSGSSIPLRLTFRLKLGLEYTHSRRTSIYSFGGYNRENNLDWLPSPRYLRPPASMPALLVCIDGNLPLVAKSAICFPLERITGPTVT